MGIKSVNVASVSVGEPITGVGCGSLSDVFAGAGGGSVGLLGGWVGAGADGGSVGLIAG
jgi:hypothetical protein